MDLILQDEVFIEVKRRAQLAEKAGHEKKKKTEKGHAYITISMYLTLLCI